MHQKGCGSSEGTAALLMMAAPSGEGTTTLNTTAPAAFHQQLQVRAGWCLPQLLLSAHLYHIGNKRADLA
jgi:hypothetical protein